MTIRTGPFQVQSAFVFFSNVRVVETAPYITLQPGLTNSGAFSLIYTQGATRS